MNATEAWLIATLLLLIVVAAVLGASEAAILRVQRVRLEISAETGDFRAGTMLSLLDDLPGILNTVLLAPILHVGLVVEVSRCAKTPF